LLFDKCICNAPVANIVSKPRTAGGRYYGWAWGLSKVEHFITVKATFTIEKRAWIYHQEIVKLHGAPNSIISNRGS
ncbi:hypothetical protein ACLOJK_022962, partial [Asimina triloba]